MSVGKLGFCRRVVTVIGFAVLVPGIPAAAQEALQRERHRYAEWLDQAPNSPYRAIAFQRVDGPVTLGPDSSDVPLDEVPPTRLTTGKSVASLEGPSGTRMIARDRPVRLGRYTIVVSGRGRQPTLLVFDPAKPTHEPLYYDSNRALVFEVSLQKAKARRVRMLTLDGLEVEAVEVGSVTVEFDSVSVVLRVRRVPQPATEEADLEISFRDRTNGDGSYPAGRFVTLIPLGDDRYRLDFNRARNPFCAYSSAYPCPVPWQGNSLPLPIPGGERYAGGGLELLTVPEAQ